MNDIKKRLYWDVRWGVYEQSRRVEYFCITFTRKLTPIPVDPIKEFIKHEKFRIRNL